jgi:hypothetical protein
MKPTWRRKDTRMVGFNVIVNTDTFGLEANNCISNGKTPHLDESDKVFKIE